MIGGGSVFRHPAVFGLLSQVSYNTVYSLLSITMAPYLSTVCTLLCLGTR